MAKVWVLDTDTKGTGAEMVPLEKVLEKLADSPEVVRVPRKPRPAPPRPSDPRQPSRFKVLDVVSREVLAEDASARDTVELLRGVRSIVDVTICAWQPEEEVWRALTLSEELLLWRSRDKLRDQAGPG
jgi:hypothetical protein